MKKWQSLKRNNRFYNHTPHDEPESLLFGTFPSFLKSIWSRFRRKKQSTAHWLSPQQIPFRSKEVSITWIGHATFLIQAADINILTDPIFGEVSTFFPRTLAPGVHFDTLPSIDYVLISHNHWDHMDAETLLALKQRHLNMKMLVPLGDKAWFTDRRFTVQEYDWWQSEEEGNVRFSFLPSVHWSGRGLFDKNKSLWGSWMIEVAGKKIYFAGDTGYGDHFKQIAHECGAPDVALMPIGPCEPKQWMARNHMGPESSLKAFDDLRAHTFIPMHWGTFPFGNDTFDLPIKKLEATKSRLNVKSIHIPKAGMKLEL